jgi:serine O-acetyltransferase
MSSGRIWRWSAALHRRGLRRTARVLQRANGLLHHNDLGAGAMIGRDLVLGHHGLGIVVHDNVIIGDRVHLWHQVTLAVRAKPGAPHCIVVEDDVMIGAGATVITPRLGSLRIGRGARIGAGAVVTSDVPAGATVVGVPAHLVRGSEQRVFLPI